MYFFVWAVFSVLSTEPFSFLLSSGKAKKALPELLFYISLSIDIGRLDKTRNFDTNFS